MAASQKRDTAVLKLMIEVGSVGNLPDRMWTTAQVQSLFAGVYKLQSMYWIGLWGACNYVFDWRALLVNRLIKRGMADALLRCFNPDKGEFWTAFDAYQEELMKNALALHVFFIGQYNRSTVSLSELLAAVLNGWHVFAYIEMMQPGQSLDGQVISEAECMVFNKMREFVLEIMEALGMPVYGSLEELADAIPISEAELNFRRFKTITPIQKSAVRSVLRKWEMDSYTVDHLITFSQNPFEAQLQVLGVIAACMTRTDTVRDTVVLFPDVTKWEGVTVDGVTVAGRLYKDMRRIVDPYLDTLLVRSTASLRIRHEG